MKRVIKEAEELLAELQAGDQWVIPLGEAGLIAQTTPANLYHAGARGELRVERTFNGKSWGVRRGDLKRWMADRDAKAEEQAA